MSTRAQLAVAAALVLGAVAVVWRSGPQEDTPAASGGATLEEHDHAAMTAAAGSAQPVRLTSEGARRIGVTFAEVEIRSLARSTARSLSYAPMENRQRTVRSRTAPPRISALSVSSSERSASS